MDKNNRAEIWMLGQIRKKRDMTLVCQIQRGNNSDITLSSDLHKHLYELIFFHFNIFRFLQKKSRHSLHTLHTMSLNNYLIVK